MSARARYQHQALLQGVTTDRSGQAAATMAKKGDKTNLILKILVAVFAVLSLALLIALIVVATRNNKEPVENGSSFGADDFCPETTKLKAPSTVRSKGLYDDLSKDELVAVRDYIINEPSLNVKAYEDAKINDNYIYLIELQQPPKAEALAYLDSNAQKPERKARVIIYNGGKSVPDVREYLVSPAGKPTKHTETTGPGQKYPIPFNSRFPDPKEIDIMDKMIRNLTRQVDALLSQSYDGYKMWDCTERCLTWGLAAPSTFKINQRKTWTWLMRDLIGYYIHPVGFEILLDTGGNDVSLWKVDKIFYNNATYDNVTDLLNAFNAGSKMFVPAPEDKGKFSSYERRGSHNPQSPCETLRCMSLMGSATRSADAMWNTWAGVLTSGLARLLVSSCLTLSSKVKGLFTN